MIFFIISSALSYATHSGRLIRLLKATLFQIMFNFLLFCIDLGVIRCKKRRALIVSQYLNYGAIIAQKWSVQSMCNTTIHLQPLWLGHIRFNCLFIINSSATEAVSGDLCPNQVVFLTRAQGLTEEKPLFFTAVYKQHMRRSCHDFPRDGVLLCYTTP